MTLDTSLGPLLREHHEAVIAALGDSFDKPVATGLCVVCGQWSLFPIVGSPRESLVCVRCYATSRYRGLALGVLRVIRELTGIEVETVDAIPAESPRSIRVLDTQPSFYSPPYAAYSLPDQLASLPWIEMHTSSYKPNVPWGTVIAGNTTSQNLEALTFDDNTFDLVITSDVMEHVRLPERAHAEIARVVAPGGRYIFTVPHSRVDEEDIVRVLVHDPDDPSRDEMVLPAEYHGSADPDEGPVLSFRVFGTSLEAKLDALGFDVDYTRKPQPRYAVFDTELFHCRRR